jgi:hypothetical protein
MRKLSEHEKWDLTTGAHVILTDTQRSSCSLMRVTKIGETGIILDRVKVLFQHRFKIYDNDNTEMYLLEHGDVLEYLNPEQDQL